MSILFHFYIHVTCVSNGKISFKSTLSRDVPSNINYGYFHPGEVSVILDPLKFYLLSVSFFAFLIQFYQEE